MLGQGTGKRKMRVARICALLWLALLAGCAAPQPAPAPVAARSDAPGHGVVVAIREVRPPAGAQVLGLVGAGPVRSGAVEVIVRADGGRTLSVVQAGADGLRPGQRVTLSGGVRTAIAAAGP